MSRFVPLLLLLLVACSNQEASQSSQGYEFLESVAASEDQVVIPYSKYRLENGLTVVIHEDHSDPLVHVDVTYHVGSAREELRRSGFAHFFEHMMFQGSENVGDEEHFRIITELGGDLNGTTNNDRTNYFETVPSNSLETMLWLESDRMGFLLEAVTEQKFEVQRATVKNERGQRVENSPYGRFGEVNSAALYPVSHPYSWPVIGYTEDLDAATVDDLKKFFLRWYGPNNAVLTIGGNVDKEEALSLAQKYFGPIPAGPDVEDVSLKPVVLNSDRYVSYLDKNIRFPALMMTFPTVPYAHEDRLALDCLADIIGNGRKSQFYKQFVLSRKAIQANSFHDTSELAGSATFFVLPYPGTALSDFEVEMRSLLANFDSSSVTEEDIQICKASRESGLIQSLASVRGKVSRLAFYETFMHNPNQISEELAQVRSLSKTDVVSAFNRYIKGKPAIIQSVVAESDPNGQARADNFEIPTRPPRQESATEDLALRPVHDNLDRSKQPKSGPVPLVEVPEFWTTTTPNGIEMIGNYNNELPLVTLRMQFEGGHMLESPEKYGLASITSQLMNEGTEKLTAEQFEIELDKLGSSISVSSGVDDTYISVVSLTEHLDETLALLEQRLFESKFTQEDLDRVRQQQIESIEAEKQQPRTIASNVYRKLLYGDSHILSVASAGEVDTLQNIQLSDVENYAGKNIAASNLRVVVVGDVTEADIKRKLGFLSRLPGNAGTIVEQATPPLPDKTVLYLVDKPGAAQSEIRIGYLTALPYDATGEYFERYLMNYVLGGAFNSRINLNLREDKGYTYGASSGFSGSVRPGPFTASASVKMDATADSVRQFVNEIEHYRTDGITETELNFTRAAIGQSDALSYETPRQKAGFLSRIIEYDLPANFVDEQKEIIDTISRDRVNALAKTHLPLENMVILVVGDKTSIYESLKELGYPIVELDTEGNTL